MRRALRGCALVVVRRHMERECSVGAGLRSEPCRPLFPTVPLPPTHVAAADLCVLLLERAWFPEVCAENSFSSDALIYYIVTMSGRFDGLSQDHQVVVYMKLS